MFTPGQDVGEKLHTIGHGHHGYDGYHHHTTAHPSQSHIFPLVPTLRLQHQCCNNLLHTNTQIQNQCQMPGQDVAIITRARTGVGQI